MEPLIEIPRSKWSQLRDLYRKHWPQGAVAYCLLDAQITYQNFSDAIGFKVYCPEGDMTNGVIATSVKDGFYQVYMHPLNRNIKKMEAALLSTSLIDWKRIPAFPSADTDVVECLKKVCESLGITFAANSGGAVKYILNRDSAPFENLSCPPNTYVGPLKPEILHLVDTTWTFHSERSYKYFETLMKNELSYVLYSLDNQPLAWINVDIETGAFSHLYCLEPHRRKGYAEFIAKIAVNDWLKKGKDILTYAIEGNGKAMDLFKKLGFKNFGVDMWIFLEKYE